MKNLLFSPFIKGETPTGSFPKFFKAIMRAFHTQRKEKVFPLIGFYADKNFYIRTKSILKKAAKYTTILEFLISDWKEIEKEFPLITFFHLTIFQEYVHERY